MNLNGKNLCAVILTVLSLAFLSFVGGAAVTKYRIFPFVILDKSFLAAEAFRKRYIKNQERYLSEWWKKVNHSKMGVTIYDKERAYNGLTLYTSVHGQKAFLITMSGQLVHEWSLPFRKVWPHTSHVPNPVSSERIYYRRAHLFSNGDLLAIYTGQGDTPYGYGLVKMDKNSQVIWSYPERVHHDFNVGEDGRIFTLVHRIRSEKISGIPNLQPPFIDDYATILSSEGQEIKRINLLEAFRDSEYSSVLDAIKKRDPLHTNTIKVVSRQIAGQFPFTQVGQILLSFRDLDLLALLDPTSKKIVWVRSGPWRKQHDPDFLDNGNILIFDNVGHFGPGGRSRVLEFEPATLKINWSYVGDQSNPFFSPKRSVQQRLPNENTLITESDSGRIFEVTSKNKIVWEYFNPVRGGDNEELIPILCGAERIEWKALKFIKQTEVRKND